jgi:hypothetical protein
MKGSSYLCSQITGGVENVVPLHVDIPDTGGRGFVLPSEISLRCFLSVLFRSRVTAVNFVLQTGSEEKITRINIR